MRGRELDRGLFSPPRWPISTTTTTATTTRKDQDWGGWEDESTDDDSSSFTSEEDDGSSQGDASDSDSSDDDDDDDSDSPTDGESWAGDSIDEDFSDSDASNSECSEDDSVVEELDPTRYHMRCDDGHARNLSNRLGIDPKLPRQYQHGVRHTTPNNNDENDIFSKREFNSPSKLLANQTTLDFLEIFCELIMDIAPMLDV